MGFWDMFKGERNLEDEKRQLMEKTTRELVERTLSNRQLNHLRNSGKRWLSDTVIVDNFEYATYYKMGKVFLSISPDRTIQLRAVPNNEFIDYECEEYRYVINDDHTCKLMNENIDNVKAAILDIGKKIDRAIDDHVVAQKREIVLEENRKREKEENFERFQGCVAKLREKIL